jgi:hypothetical protein
MHNTVISSVCHKHIILKRRSEQKHTVFSRVQKHSVEKECYRLEDEKDEPDSQHLNNTA